MSGIELRPGDLLAFWGCDWLSVLISVITCGPSHVGIITEWNGGTLLVESTTLVDAPCVVRGEVTAGAQAHWPSSRVAEYNGRVAIYRLKHHWRLTKEQSDTLTDVVIGDFVEGKATYDLSSAIVSGSKWIKWSRWLPYPDDGSVFCSELCALAYMRLGRLNLGDAERYNPASLVRSLRRSGVVEAREWIK